MDRGRGAKRVQWPIRNVLFRMAGILLILTLLSAQLVGGIYAKYTTSASRSDSARVAKGLPAIELLESQATLVNGVYTLGSAEVAKNTYDQVIPGVDIPKNPFVRLTGESEVSYALYLKAIEAGVPPTVTYELNPDWSRVNGQDGVYKYTGTIKSGEKIDILKDNQLMVSEHYEGNGKSFSLTFSAWIEQVD